MMELRQRLAKAVMLHEPDELVRLVLEVGQ
jgi:hypothetical protein